MEMRKLREKATEAFAKGRFSKAAEFYEEYCKAEPKDHQARLRMGDAWAKAGQKDRAISAYQLAATGFAKEGFLPRAIAASKLILELDPAHKGVQHMLADLYARKGVGGASVPQAPSRPARRVDLPAFTENMGVSMGPAAAPLELPEEDEPARGASAPPPEDMEIPVHAPLEIPAQAPQQAPVRAAQAAPATELHEIPMHAPLEIPVHAPLDVPAQASRQPQAQALQEIPVHAPLEIPQSAQETPAPAPVSHEIPLHAPLEIPEAPAEEELAVVQGVAVPVPASGSPPGLAPRAAPQRPSVSVPAVAAEAPRPAPAAPAAKPTPAAPTAPAAPVQRPPTASPEDTALEVDLGSGTKKLSWAAVSEPLFSATPAAGASAPPAPDARAAAAPAPSAPAPSSAAPPGLRPRRTGEAGGPDMAVTPAPGRSAVVPAHQASASAFTELDLDGDTLLHAVEEAAISGVKQRAATSAGAAPQGAGEESILDDEVIITELASPDSLPNIPLFSDLPQDAFIELFERCPLLRFSVGQRVFEQGSHGNAFYVICEGSVRVSRQDGVQRKDLATLTSGAFFGEMALLSGAPRMASVESAAEDTQLLEISAPLLAELSRQHPQVARALKKFCRERMLSNVMSTSAIFEPFNRKDRRTLVEKFRAREVNRNEVIVREGENTDGLYIVLSGEVEARKGDQVLSRLKEGELFGEISLLSKTPATATVMATRRTSLLRLPREDFDALILSHPQILVLVSELSEQRLRRTEALTGGPVIELSAEDLLV